MRKVGNIKLSTDVSQNHCYPASRIQPGGACQGNNGAVHGMCRSGRDNVRDAERHEETCSSSNVGNKTQISMTLKLGSLFHQKIQ